VTHAAITENKRLGAVLEAVKEMQDAAAPKVTTVGKQRTRYQPTGRRRKPQKCWMDGRAARRVAEANCPAFGRRVTAEGRPRHVYFAEPATL
jgi:hypothetical protein